MSEVLRERLMVTGAEGCISHHLVARKKRRGYWVRGVDLKRSEYTPIDADRYKLLDLRRWDECLLATPERGSHLHAGRRHGKDRVISGTCATILRNTAFTDLDIFGASRLQDVPQGGQRQAPGRLGYGRRRADPLVLLRRRPVKGIYQLMQSNYPPPLYPGTEEMLSINQLARLIIEASGTPDITIRHIDRLQGVCGRNSDISPLRQVVGLKPAIPLEVGLPETYRGIEK